MALTSKLNIANDEKDERQGMENLWQESDKQRSILQVNIDELTKAMEDDVVKWISK